MDAAIGESHPEGKEGTSLKLYPKRRQNEQSRKRISEYQQKKWRLIRAVQSGAVTLESLPADQRAMIEHAAGIQMHPRTDKSTGTSTKAGTGLSATKSPHPVASGGLVRDVKTK